MKDIFEENLGSFPPEVVADMYSDAECQYYIVPGTPSEGPGGEYGCEEPDSPGLTRRGWVRWAVGGLITGAGGEEGPGGGVVSYLAGQ